MLCCCVWIINLLIKSPCCYLFAWSIGWCCLMLPNHKLCLLYEHFQCCCCLVLFGCWLNLFETSHEHACSNVGWCSMMIVVAGPVRLLLLDVLNVVDCCCFLVVWMMMLIVLLHKPNPHTVSRNPAYVLVAVCYMLHKHHECIIMWCPWGCLSFIC